MARTKSSARWLKEFHGDRYVRRAREAGYRSRSAYKLMEIQRSDAILAPGSVVVDLGAAPGGWSQYAVERAGRRGAVIAADVLPMDPVAGVTSIQGDFRDEETLARVLDELDGRLADLVISDMAPNMSGMAAVDQPRAMLLAELALDLAARCLRPGGAFVVKVFQGEGFEAFLRELRARFGSVRSRKPGASRARSREVYLVAMNYRSG